MKKTIFGEVHGNIPVPPAAAAAAAKLALAEYDSAEANEFSGDPVEVLSIPTWAPAIATWWPEQALAAMGYQLRMASSRDSKARQDIVVTMGVDAHTDDFHGVLLCYVLHNDGLSFKQGRIKSTPKAGDWFLFDDRIPHGVREAKGKSVFIGWTVPLNEIDRVAQAT